MVSAKIPGLDKVIFLFQNSVGLSISRTLLQVLSGIEWLNMNVNIWLRGLLEHRDLIMDFLSI